MEETNFNPEKETTRLEAFSDGVFAVAITLLALEIAIPRGVPENNQALREAIFSQWTRYLAYFNSFATVLLMWMAHHSIFRIIRRTSGRLMLANGLLLLVIVLVPFPTKTMGEFINTPARDTAVQFYTGYFILVSITFNLLIWVVSRNRDILSLGVTRQQTRRLQLLQLRGLFFNGLIFAVAFFNAWVALAMSIATWVFWAILIRD